MDDEHITRDRDLGNGGIYYRNRKPFPNSPEIMLANAEKKPRGPSVTWADELGDANAEAIQRNGGTVHQNGCVRKTSNTGNGGMSYPGVLDSQHIEGKSACVVEIRRNSVQKTDKQTFTNTNRNQNPGDYHIRRPSHFADLMKTRRLESLRRTADEKARCENTRALLGGFTERDKPYRNKVEYFGIVLTFIIGLGNVVRFSFLCHQHGGGKYTSIAKKVG